MPKDVVEVELKIKSKWGKYTLLRDFYTRTEKYRPWERADKCTRIYSQRRTTQQTKTREPQDSKGATTSTDSGISPQAMVEAFLLGFSLIPITYRMVLIIQVTVMQKL